MFWVSHIFFTYLIFIIRNFIVNSTYHKLVYVLLDGGRRREEL